MEDAGITPQCYCGALSREPDMIRCGKCERYFHKGCLKSGNPTTLLGDVFYHLTCVDCSESQDEACERMKLQWLQVVILTLYNLQLTSTGKRGYFRWKEHICSFIDRNWNNFFGQHRKKTTTWFGTVAGTLSSGCPKHFKSGLAELGENGWWTLTENKLPSLGTVSGARVSRQPKVELKETSVPLEGLRRRQTKTSFEAAMEIKAKRAMTTETRTVRRLKGDRQSIEQPEALTPALKPALTAELVSVPKPEAEVVAVDTQVLMETSLTTEANSMDDVCMVAQEVEIDRDVPFSKIQTSTLNEADIMDQDSQLSVASSSSALWLTERDLVVGSEIPQCLLMEDDDADNSDLDIDICAITPPASPSLTDDMSDSLPQMEELLASLNGASNKDLMDQSILSASMTESQSVPDKHTPSRDETTPPSQLTECSVLPKNQGEGHAQSEAGSESGEPSESDAEDRSSDSDGDNRESPERIKKKARLEDTDRKEEAKQPSPVRYTAMSLYEERQLLKQLKALGSVVDADPRSNRFKRKLIVRQLKRERGHPVFDFDQEVNKHLSTSSDQCKKDVLQDFHHPRNIHGVPMVRYTRGHTRVLDRFQLGSGLSRLAGEQPMSFLNRLVGTDDAQLVTVSSPYTARMLKPFIWRDYESRPLKMRLLEEIRAYPHRNEPSWVAPPSAPIDYCYVRPQHIPSINTVCREFFWPGIDLSECLQYPDFSCVALYRKFVIAFAFMVPDVKFNEAYISFIFTHPEWRGAGIATFMIYHLIQTCMGKDVTLHVSASNVAMLLYQRFGFKPEEFILDFYDKYFPEESKECRHAFFLRLGR